MVSNIAVHWIDECFRHARMRAWNVRWEAGRGVRGSQWTSEGAGSRLRAGMTLKCASGRNRREGDLLGCFHGHLLVRLGE
jgi:hypothetical protein